MNYELPINPIACDAHGVCAELLPEIIELDPWGYPIVMSAGGQPTWSNTPRGRLPRVPCWPWRWSLSPAGDRGGCGRVANQHWQRPLEPLFTRS
jgi:hypothetical protein